MPVFGSLRARLKKKVLRDLAETPAWGVRVQGKGWVCPFCLSVACEDLPRDEDARGETVLDHLLDGPCAPFRKGEGQERPLADVRRVAERRELRRLVKRDLAKNPAWQLLDLRRHWWCPFCGEPTSVEIPADHTVTETTLEAVAAHVETCFGWDKGRGEEKPLEVLRATVKQSNRAKKLSEDVRRKLEQDPLWRQKDSRARWVCPFCLKTQEHVDLSTPLFMFENAPALIARHLVASCEPWRAGSPPRQAGGDREQAPPPAARLPAPKPEGAREPSTSLLAYRGPGPPERADRGGITLRKLESSGEYTKIDDTEVRKLAKPGASSGHAREADWRAELERELDEVRSQVPSGTLEESAGRPPDEESIAADAREVAHVADGLAGIEVRALARAATPPRGDFVEAVRVGRGKIAVILGGVAGQDADSALIAAMTRNLLRIHAQRGEGPGDALRRTNQEVFADLDARTFVSAAFLLLDAAARTLEVARAGLPAPLVVSRSRSPDPILIDSEGMVMGIDRGPIFDTTLEVRRVELRPGDLVFSCTAGFFELKNASRNPLAPDALRSLVGRYGGHEAEYLLHKVGRFLEDFTRGTDATADACAIAVKVEDAK